MCAGLRKTRYKVRSIRAKINGMEKQTKAEQSSGGGRNCAGSELNEKNGSAAGANSGWVEDKTSNIAIAITDCC